MATKTTPKAARPEAKTKTTRKTTPKASVPEAPKTTRKARTEANRILREAIGLVREAAAAIGRAEAVIGRERVRIGLAIVAVEAAAREVPEILGDHATAVERLTVEYPAMASWSPKTVSEARSAGRVASVLGPEAIGEAPAGTLSVFGRWIPAMLTGEAKTEAEASLVLAWSDFVSGHEDGDPWPSREAAEAFADAAGKTGTRGKQAGSGKGSGGKGSGGRSTRKGRGSAGKASGTVEPTDEDRAKLSGEVRRFLGRVEDPSAYPVVEKVLLFGIRIGAEYGREAAEAAIRGEIKARTVETTRKTRKTRKAA